MSTFPQRRFLLRSLDLCFSSALEYPQYRGCGRSLLGGTGYECVVSSIPEAAGSALECYAGAGCRPHIDLLAFGRWTARLDTCAWSMCNAVFLVQCFAR